MKCCVRLAVLSAALLAAAHQLHLYAVDAQLQETDRQEEYFARGHVWPPKLTDYTPSTDGWRRTWERRFRQIEQMEDTGNDRYNGWMSSVHSAFLCPNFTESGWGLTRAPQDVVDRLASRLQQGLISDNPREERGDHGVDGANMPLFVDAMKMAWDILEELKPMHEAWAGVELTGHSAYGLRVYRNSSNLGMHLDRSATHIISSILHIDHGE